MEITELMDIIQSTPQSRYMTVREQIGAAIYLGIILRQFKQEGGI